MHGFKGVAIAIPSMCFATPDANTKLWHFVAFYLAVGHVFRHPPTSVCEIETALICILGNKSSLSRSQVFNFCRLPSEFDNDAQGNLKRMEGAPKFQLKPTTKKQHQQYK